MNIHERITGWHSEEGVFLFRQMNLPKNSVFMDFGCGYGEYTIALAYSDASSIVYAIDSDNKMPL